MRKLLVYFTMLVVVACTSTSQAGLDDFQPLGGGVWSKAPIDSHDYLSLADNTAAVGNFYGARSDSGIYNFHFDGANWNPSLIVGGTPPVFDAVGEHGGGGAVVGAARGGGLTEYYWVGAPIYNSRVIDASNEYTGIVSNPGVNGNFFASRSSTSGGGIYNFHFDGANWGAPGTVTATGVFNTIGENGNGGSIVGAAQGGGLTEYYWDGGGFSTRSIDASNEYVALANHPTVAGNFYAARSSGGIYNFHFDGANWGAPSLVDNSSGKIYVALEPNPASGTGSLFGAQSDGTLDLYTWVGFYALDTISTGGGYGVLQFGNSNGALFAGTIPEPTTVALLGLGSLLIRRRRRR